MKLSGFQLGIIGLFILFILGGMAAFATFGGFGGQSVGVVTIWGTTDAEAMNNLIQDLRQTDKAFQDVNYVQKKDATYHRELIDAMASGTGPDLFLITQDYLVSFADKTLTIPYSAVPQATFLSAYIDEGRLFLTPEGAIALPFTLDPLVMFWNRTLLANAGQSQPPIHWNDLITFAPKLTKIDGFSNVTRSAVALGGWDNIDRAKEIYATLALQAGDPIVERGEDGAVRAQFGLRATGATEDPATSALRFYTDFGNPSKTVYSWNRSLPSSFEAFTAGDLALYFGLGSERIALAEANPNLQFSLAVVPQLRSGQAMITYGLMTGVAIARTAGNMAGAAVIAQKLTSAAAAPYVVTHLGIPSARRDAPTDTSTDAGAAVLAQSALVSRAWLDPDASQTDGIFQDMVESVVSGRLDPSAAVAEASQRIRSLIPASN